MTAFAKKFHKEYLVTLRLLLALFFVLTLHCKMQVVEGSGDGPILHFLYKFARSFQSANLTDIFVLASAYTLIAYVSTHGKSVDIKSALVSALFSGAWVVSRSYLAYNNVSFINGNNFQIFISAFCFIGFGMIFYLCLRAVIIALSSHSGNLLTPSTHGSQAADHKSCWKSRFFLLSFFVILVCWLPWILCNYPGTFCPDSNGQLSQFFAGGFNAHHPPLSTYIMGFLVVIGEKIIDTSFGCFLYLLLQTVFGAFVFSYGLDKLNRHWLRLRWCIIGTLFFALTPFWGSFAQWYEKDLLYAEMTALFLIVLAGTVYNKHVSVKDAVLLSITGLLASLLRNNGIYAVIPAILLLVLFVNKKSKYAALLTMIVIIMLYGGIVKGLYPQVLGITDGSIKEALSIPFQQTARYVTYYGNEVTDEEKAAIDAVLTYDELVGKYNPIISDPIKSMYKGDNSKLGAYFKVWFEMFFKHPNEYISATLNGAYGYLAPVATNIEPSVNYDLSSYSFVTELGVTRAFGVENAQLIASFREASMNLPIVRYLCMPGLYTWITIFCFLILWKKKCWYAMPLLIPEFMNILVCIASPLSNAIRYELPVVAAAPFILGWCLIAVQRKPDSNVSDSASIG